MPWRTHVFLARTADTELAPQDAEEIAGARWGTLDELGGPLRERLLATGHAFWRYRVALHDAALRASALARRQRRRSIGGIPPRTPARTSVPGTDRASTDARVRPRALKPVDEASHTRDGAWHRPLFAATALRG